MISENINIEKTWESAWLIYKNNLKYILLLVLIIYVPIYTIRLIFPYEQIYNRFGLTVYELTIDLIRILASLVGVISFISISIITEESVRGKDFTIREVLFKSCLRWWAYIKSTFLSGIIILLFTLLLVVPGIIRSLQYVFVGYAASLRNLSGKKALEYSKRVTEGQRWRVFGFYLLLGIIGLGPIAGYIYLLSITDNDKLIVYLFLIIQNFISPFFTILYGILFLDLEKQWKNREMLSRDGYISQTEQSFSSP